MEILALAGLRADGRKSNEMRRIRHKLSLFSSDGSTYLETGLNKVLVIVTGPMEPRNSTEQDHTKVF